MCNPEKCQGWADGGQKLMGLYQNTWMGIGMNIITCSVPEDRAGRGEGSSRVVIPENEWGGKGVDTCVCTR